MTNKILSLILSVMLAGQGVPVSWAADLPQGYEAVAGSSSYTVAPDGLSGTLVAHDGVTIGQWSGGFNIGDGHSFTALIPEGGAHLSRDITDSPSRIFGALNVPTGKFFLVNTSGIYFSPTASVNAAGLVASSLDITDEDFLAGRYDFFQSGAASYVVNDGLIQAGEGGAYLLGGAVRNRGTIVSRTGHVELAGGSKMTLALDPQGYLSVAVTDQVRETVTGPDGRLSAAASNSGVLRSEGGVVVLTAETAGAVFDDAVNQSGLIEADTVGSREGRIFLGSRTGEGVVRQTGTVRARGDEALERGGSIDILGQKVGLFDGTVDASGVAGGGVIRIGGDKQGKGDVRLAEAVYVAPEAAVRADALTHGDGGQIIVWSEESTRVYGALSARGGAESGDGGFVETSSREDLEVASNPDVSAYNGVGGTWLLDPRNVDVTAATLGGAFAGGNPDVFTPTANNATVSATSINTALDNGISVFINTGNSGAQAGNIRILAPIVKSSGARASLVLSAIGDVTTTSAISAAGAAILDVEIIALDDLSIQSAITTGGGDVNLFGDQFTMTAAGSITTSGGAVDLTGANAVSIGGAISTSGGDVTMTTSHNISVTATGSISSGAGDIALSATGATRDISISGALSTTSGDVSLIANDAVTVSSSITSTSGDVLLQGGGNVTLSGANADITTGGDYTATADADANGSGNYVQNNAGSAVNIGGDTTITAVTANLTGTHAGTGDLTLRPSTATTSVGIGGGAGTFNLTDAELTRLLPGYASITIGRDDSTALATVSSSAFNDPTTIVMGGAGGRVTVTGAVTTTNDALTLAAGTGDTGTLTINPGIAVSTGSGDVTLRGDSVAIGAGATINTTGDVTLEPASSARPIVLAAAGAASDFALTAAELAAINTSANSLIIGRADGTHGFTTTGFTSAEPTVFRGFAGPEIVPAVSGASGGLDLNTVTANHFALNSVGDILDGNGAAVNLIASATSTLTSGGIAGTLADPIEVNITSGNLILDLSGMTAGVSAAFEGTIGGTIVILNAPGLVYFNGVAINAGSPPAPVGLSDDAQGILELSREYNGLEMTRLRPESRPARGTSDGLFDLGAMNRLARVIIDPELLRRWIRVRPAVVEAPKPVVVPTPLPVPPVEVVRPVPTPVVTPAPTVPAGVVRPRPLPVSGPAITPVDLPAVQPAVVQPTVPARTVQPLPADAQAPVIPGLNTPTTPLPLPRLAGGPLRQVEVEEEKR